MNKNKFPKKLLLNKKSISNLEANFGGRNEDTGGCVTPSRLASRCPRVFSNCEPCTLFPTENITICTLPTTVW